MKVSKKVVRLGIDLGKNSFHLWGVDERGELALKCKLKRKQLLVELAKRPKCVVAMEACAGAHHWGREISKLGHEVRLMAPQFVKAYVKSNKNDFNDAEGICEAASRPNMRFVALKSVEQQELQAAHRLREMAVKTRTMHVNQIRGLAAELGIVLGEGIAQIRRRVPEILEDGENVLTPMLRSMLWEAYEFFKRLDERVSHYDGVIKELFAHREECRRLEAVEGIGPLTATAVVAAYGDARQFGSARQFAAALGLVPRQHSTGDKARLLGISKRGDRYVRTLLIHGARSVVNTVVGRDKSDKRSLWVKRLVRDRGRNRAAVALANKNARILWALLSRGDTYRVAL